MTAYQYPLLIKQILMASLTHNPQQEIIYSDKKRYDYREFSNRVARLAGALQNLGVREGSVVAVLDWDSHRYLESFFAVPMIGATLHTVNIRLSDEQILYTINHAQDDIIICHVDFLETLAKISSKIQHPWQLVVISEDGVYPDILPIKGEYEHLLSKASLIEEFADFDENIQATLFYTTGTTGDPKGVSYTQRQLVLHTMAVSAGLSMVPTGGLNRSDVYMPITPLFHVHGWGIPYVATLMGLRQIYPGRYDPAGLLGLIQKHGVTFSHCVPTILAMILGAPEAEKTDLSRWKVIIGGSALSEGLAKQAMDMGIDIHAAYGLSETCPFLTMADMMATRDDNASIQNRIFAGKPAPFVQVRVVDEDMSDVPCDGSSSGEIVARAPWLTQAYLKNEQATEALWHGGWMHTGDVGRFDENGRLHITDRLKDVIKTGGEWISSLELENIASTIQGVDEVAAIGIADKKWGERPLMVIATKMKTADISHKLNALFTKAVNTGSLSKWAIPDRIEFIDKLPKTSVGKIDKKSLRRIYT